jgi:hypothetical protein
MAIWNLNFRSFLDRQNIFAFGSFAAILSILLLKLLEVEGRTLVDFFVAME